MQEEKKPNLESRKLSQNNSKMNRRTYEKNLSDVKIPHHYTGFTNRILIQEVEAKKQTDVQTINFFIPVYVILKIKSIQDIDIQKLTGSISSVIIINVKIQNLPEPIIYLLETGMTIQLNRSQLVQLKESQENNISVSKKDTMLIFTLRKTINGSIVEDTLWSPFEVVRIVLSITFNSIKKEGEEISHVYLQNEWRKKQRKGTFENIIVKQIGKKFLPPNTLQKREKPQIYFDQIKDYNISFNCMRNNHFIPISYSMGCVYSVYDLAERKLQSYHTNLDSYSEIVRKYQKKPDYTAKSKQQKSSKEGKEQKVQNATNNLDKSVILTSDHEQFLKRSSSFVSQYLQEIYTQPKEGSVQKGLKKPKYYQYTHFVIPLYKYPGNSLATIFVPIFLLGLLSLAIFFQDNQLSERIGSIATMVLGYIALIPSIKEQLPPSSRITIIERVIYLSTLCCLLSLTQSFMVDQDDDYVFIWTQNKLFLLCLGIHISVFVFILSLLAIHKLKWQKQYNYEKQVKIPDPVKANDTWINIYCDQQFFKVNNQNYKNQKKQKNTKQLIKKYEPKYKQEIPPPSKQKNAFFASIIGQGKVENVFENIQPIIPKDANKRQTVDQQQGSNSKSQFQTELFGSMLASKNVQMLGSSRLDQIGRQIERQDSMNISKSKSKISKPKLMHHSSLEFLDDLIKSGKHFSFTENHKVKPHQAVKNKILKKMRNSLKSD